MRSMSVLISSQTWTIVGAALVWTPEGKLSTDSRGHGLVLMVIQVQLQGDSPCVISCVRLWALCYYCLPAWIRTTSRYASMQFRLGLHGDPLCIDLFFLTPYS